jgi:hypothetical protein
MATKIGSLFYEITAETGKFEKGLSSSKDQASKFKSGISDAIEELTGFNLASLAGAGGIAMLGKALGDALMMAAETERIQAQLGAVIKSTGGVAGMTAESINAMAEEMKALNAIDDDAVVSASNVMLTFTNVGETVFPSAMQAAVDLSAAMGQDLQSSVVQLGKALNDPITGITSLQRVGVTFTQTQKDLIKGFMDIGDAASAQKIVLDELSREFGGSGAAAANTYAGQVKKLQMNMEDLQKSIGSDLLPIALTYTTAANNLGKAHDELNKRFPPLLANMPLLNALYAVGMTRLEEFKDAEVKVTKSGFLHAAMMDEKQTPAITLLKDVSATAAEEMKNIALGAQGATQAGLAQGDAYNKLKDATDRLKEAQSGWMLGAGGDVKAELEAQGIKGEKLKDALRALDVQYGTSFAAQAGYKEDVTKLVAAYKQGGEEAIPKFIAGLGGLETNWASQSKGIQEVRTEIINLQSSLDLLVSKSYNVAVNMVTGTSSAIYTNGGRGKTSATNSSNTYVDPLSGPGGANGLDFTVPPGYPNDSYPMRVQSGEHVVVTPAGEASKSAGNTYNFYYSGNASAQQIEQAYEMARITG